MGRMSENVIEVFADIVCPFTHVGLQRLVERRRQLDRDDVRLLVRALPLELINGEPMDPEAVAAKVASLREQVSPELFVGFDPSRFPSTSLPALALTNAGYRRAPATGEAVALELRRLVFDAGVDVSRPEVLAGVAERHGIETGDPVDEAAVLADLEESRQRGVIGSPHFFIPGGESLFCPTLELARTGDALDIALDIERFGRLVDSSFR